MGIRVSRDAERPVDRSVDSDLPAARAAPGSFCRRARLHSQRSGGTGRASAMGSIGAPPADLGVSGREISHRSHLVVLPLLAREISQPAVRADADRLGMAAG